MWVAAKSLARWPSWEDCLNRQVGRAFTADLYNEGALDYMVSCFRAMQAQLSEPTVFYD
jgi:hypothetical protein